MKKATFFSVIIILLITGCGGNRKSGDNIGSIEVVDADIDAFITVDITKKYPKKELILQDFMDVEYIALDTNDDFLNQGVVKDIGKEIILVINRNHDGDIFVYNRFGKTLRKINRKGQGGEEYTRIYNITLDEENREMFVNDVGKRKIFVYDLYGKYIRSFEHSAVSEVSYYTDIFNYDR
ncbi:MAG: 6-bladed beta-propeller, partial [Tannerella sp.]|nr:6-bladed beta-propeller [Tannerella sp.]